MPARSNASLCRAGAIAALVPLLACLTVESALAGRRLALVIGIDHYDNLPQDRTLTKAVGDAQAMSGTLAKLGFEVETGLDVDRHDFNRLWAGFIARLSPDDSAVFHFSGHGIELLGLNYLVVRDAPNVSMAGETLLRDESIALNRLLEDLRIKGPKVSLLILDACRNNPFDDGRGRSIGAARGLAGLEAPKGTFILYSAGIGQTALDRLSDADLNPSSIYTRTLLPLFATPGLSLSDIAKKVRGRVRALALTAGYDQTPAYYDELVGDFYPAGEAGDGAPKAYDKIAEAKEVWMALKDTKNELQLAKFIEDYADTPIAHQAGLRQAELKKHAADAAAECGRLAASPYNDEHKNGGIEAGKIDAGRAIPACREAVAANSGSPRLMYQLGRAFYGKDPNESAKWFEIAAAKGYGLAMANLGIPLDYAKAKLWIERGAAAGEIHAITALGVLYFEGRAVPQDYAKAKEWFEKSAAKGDTDAMTDLGVLYADGDGVARNFGIARSWLEKAAAKGDPQAMHNLAQLYEDGEGVRRNPAKAQYWAEKAKGFGYLPKSASAAQPQR